jgi:hypothetical protein
LTAVEGDAWILEDPALSQAAAEQLIAEIDTLGGETQVCGNGP